MNNKIKRLYTNKIYYFLILGLNRVFTSFKNKIYDTDCRFKIGTYTIKVKLEYLPKIYKILVDRVSFEVDIFTKEKVFFHWQHIINVDDKIDNLSFQVDLCLKESKIFSENFENYEEVFETRIEKLKDKESFIVQNSKELGLTLTPENKIAEFSSAIEEEYKENVETFINTYKENLFSNLVGGLEKLEKEFARNINTDDEEKKEKIQKENYKIALESSKSSLRLNSFYPMIKKVIENSMILEISEDDIKDKTIKKNKLFKKVKGHNKDFSENVSLNEKTFDDIFEKIDFTKYEKLSTNKIEFQVETPKAKTKEIVNEKEKEMDI